MKTLTRRSTTRPRPSTVVRNVLPLQLYSKHDTFNGIFAATSLDHRSETRMARNVSFPIQRQKRTHWVPTQRQQQAKSTTNNPASIFFGIPRWIRRFDITKQVCTTSHFRNFLMSKSKWDFLSERRNRRSNADATPTTSKINNQQSSFHFSRALMSNSSISFNQTCVYDFSLPKFPNVPVKTRFFIRMLKSQIKCCEYHLSARSATSFHWRNNRAKAFTSKKHLYVHVKCVVLV